jgi:hypothetical protein
MEPTYITQYGSAYQRRAEDVLVSEKLKKHQDAVDLIFTSPPFPLLRKKNMGIYKVKNISTG